MARRGAQGWEMALSKESVHLRVAVSRAVLESFDTVCKDLGYPRHVRLALLRLVVELALTEGGDALRCARIVVEARITEAMRETIRNLKKRS